MEERRESDKIRSVVSPLLEGKSVLDIGCGLNAWKIVPWAIGVDYFRAEKPNHKADASPYSSDLDRLFGRGRFDVVFSSHALEHMPAPILTTLRHWLHYAKVEGLFVLYLPDERHYVFDSERPKARNPEHFHYLTQDVFAWYLDQLENLAVERNELRVVGDEHSFLVVGRKLR